MGFGSNASSLNKSQNTDRKNKKSFKWAYFLNGNKKLSKERDKPLKTSQKLEIKEKMKMQQEQERFKKMLAFFLSLIIFTLLFFAVKLFLKEFFPSLGTNVF